MHWNLTLYRFEMYFSMRWALSSFIFSLTCPYTSRVKAAVAWPKFPCMVFTLCYSDLGYHEIRHKLNGRFLLTCIENWFRKTSMNQLHRPDQPLEPFFPYVNNVFIWNWKNGKHYFDKYIVEDCEFGKLMYQSSAGNYFAVFYHLADTDSSNLIHDMPKTLQALLHSLIVSMVCPKIATRGPMEILPIL